MIDSGGEDPDWERALAELICFPRASSLKAGESNALRGNWAASRNHLMTSAEAHRMGNYSGDPGEMKEAKGCCSEEAAFGFGPAKSGSLREYLSARSGVGLPEGSEP